MEVEFSEAASAIDLIEARYHYHLGHVEFGRKDIAGFKNSSRLDDLMSSKILQRWLASLLPDYAAEKIPDGSAAPVLKKVTISPASPEAPTLLCFKYNVEDRDEDLVHIRFDLWYVENGIKFMIHENRDKAYRTFGKI